MTTIKNRLDMSPTMRIGFIEFVGSKIEEIVFGF